MCHTDDAATTTPSHTDTTTFTPHTHTNRDYTLSPTACTPTPAAAPPRRRGQHQQTSNAAPGRQTAAKETRPAPNHTHTDGFAAHCCTLHTTHPHTPSGRSNAAVARRSCRRRDKSPREEGLHPNGFGLNSLRVDFCSLWASFRGEFWWVSVLVSGVEECGLWTVHQGQGIQ